MSNPSFLARKTGSIKKKGCEFAQTPQIFIIFFKQFVYTLGCTGKVF